MKTGLFTTLVALAVACVLAAPAAAATPTPRKLASQIKVMQRQIKVLPGPGQEAPCGHARGAGHLRQCARLLGLLHGSHRGRLPGHLGDDRRDQCGHLTRPDQYPAPTPIADPLNSCQLLEVQRQPGAVPPTTNVFAALLNIFR